MEEQKDGSGDKARREQTKQTTEVGESGEV